MLENLGTLPQCLGSRIDVLSVLLTPGVFVLFDVLNVTLTLLLLPGVFVLFDVLSLTLTLLLTPGVFVLLDVLSVTLTLLLTPSVFVLFVCVECDSVVNAWRVCSV